MVDIQVSQLSILGSIEENTRGLRFGSLTSAAGAGATVTFGSAAQGLTLTVNFNAPVLGDPNLIGSDFGRALAQQLNVFLGQQLARELQQSGQVMRQ